MLDNKVEVIELETKLSDNGLVFDIPIEYLKDINENSYFTLKYNVKVTQSEGEKS